jgi:2-methylisocitrate lyase-like PEP mutase family enzyme
MSHRAQRELAERFRRLHQGPDLLVVGSVWDAGSAVVFARAGFRALATSSAGVAFSLGYPDGQRIARGELLEAVARIARAVAIPVSADVESGFGGSPDEVADTCRAVLESGAIGVNLEDASGDDGAPLIDAAEQAARLRAVRRMADQFGVPLVINARTDTYLVGYGDDATRFDETIRRLALYRAAGADCLFVPGVSDRDLIARLTRAIDGPLNILASVGTPPLAELRALGVRRVSQGSGPARAALSCTQRVARELLDRGTYETYTTDTLNYAEANALFDA